MHNYIIHHDLSEKDNVENFLKANSDYSLFLLNNLYEYGFNLGDAPNSGNFYSITQNGKVVCVFALAKRGSLLISSVANEEIYPLILETCLKEPMPIRGVIGEWDTCKGFWEYLKDRQVIQQETKVSKEVLYILPMNDQQWKDQHSVRRLLVDDFEQWFKLRELYREEMGFPNIWTKVELKTDFLSKVKKGIIWGYFHGEKLTSIADLNAFTPPYGQLGGVFTLSNYRRQGMSKKVMRLAFSDCRNILGLERLTIFTGCHNVGAQNLYTSMGAQLKGHFALLFGR